MATKTTAELMAAQNAITDAARTIGDGAEDKNSLVIGVSQVPDEEEGHQRLAVFMAGNPDEMANAITRAMAEDRHFKNAIMRAAQTYTLRRFFGKDAGPCDCPACTAERAAKKESAKTDN